MRQETKEPYHLWVRVIVLILFLIAFSFVVTGTPLHSHPVPLDLTFVAGVVLIFGLQRRQR